MKTKKYLTASEIISLWDTYQETLSARVAAERAGVAYNTASRMVREIESALEGEPITRKKGAGELKRAVREIRVSQVVVRSPATPALGEAPPQETPSQSLPTEDAEQKIERLWNELKVAVVNYALEAVVMEEAKKSSIVGLIKRGLSR